jgi:hypothetical protein
MERWRDGEMERWRDGEMERWSTPQLQRCWQWGNVRWTHSAPKAQEAEDELNL